MSGSFNDLTEYEYGVLMTSIDAAYTAMGAPTEKEDPDARDPFSIGEAVAKALRLKDIQIRSLQASLEAAREMGAQVQREADSIRSERDYAMGYAGDLAVIRKALDDVDAPHDPEDGVSLEPRRIHLLAQMVIKLRAERDAARERATGGTNKP